MTHLERLHARRERHRQRSLVVRVSVALGGFATLLGGLALLVLPGPGIPLIVLGLALLALEFRWAEAALGRAVRHAERVTPEKRSHQVIVVVAAVVIAAAVAVAAVIWGVPGL